MKTTGIFQMADFTVELAGANKPIKLVVFGDVHWDSDQHDRQAWLQFLRATANYKNAVFLGMGDYLESYSARERSTIKCGGLHETSIRKWERDAQRTINDLAEQMRATMGGRLLGLLGGNHYYDFPDGTTSDMRLAQALDSRFLGVCAALRLSMRFGGSSVGAVDIFAHHGRGAARTIGGSLTAVQRLMDCCEADIHLMGDDHKLGVVPTMQKLRLVNAGSGKGVALSTRTPWIARTGGFSRGYEPGVPSYVVDRALPPTMLGWVEFDIGFRRSHTGRNLYVHGSAKTL
ncbi:MAG TPA: hypothetical protein VM238_17975 [Phycisphaerae bacterium]|nr:hypothetical protein [Phycisphaerae bacterium]